MAAERNGREEYDQIRSFLTYIYLYGFLSREDFIQLKLCSGAGYDQCTKLLKAVLPELEKSMLWENSRKYLRFSRSYTQSTESQLANTYLLHTIRQAELTEFLVILARLSHGGATQQQLANELELFSPDEDTSKYNAARNHRMELQDYGYLVSKGRYFHLISDPLKLLDDRQLTELSDYLHFCTEVTYPRVPGSYLKRSISRELKSRGLSMENRESPFLFRRNDCRNILDEDVAFQLREAIQSRRWVKVRCLNRNSVILPLTLRIDVRLGRWYLLYWDGSPQMARLSNLTVLKPGKPENTDRWQLLFHQVTDAFEHSGVSGLLSETGPIHVEAELCFEDSDGIYRRFRRDIPMGEIRKFGDRELFIAETNDPMEFVPLLRQYAPWLRILPGSHNLDHRIRSDLEQMRRQLEDVV